VNINREANRPPQAVQADKIAVDQSLLPLVTLPVQLFDDLLTLFTSIQFTSKGLSV